MVALLALRAYPLLTPPVQGAGHMGGDKPGRNGNNGVSDVYKRQHLYSAAGGDHRLSLLWRAASWQAAGRTREGDVAFHGQMVKRPQSLQTYLRGR